MTIDATLPFPYNMYDAIGKYIGKWGKYSKIKPPTDAWKTINYVFATLSAEEELVLRQRFIHNNTTAGIASLLRKDTREVKRLFRAGTNALMEPERLDILSVGIAQYTQLQEKGLKLVDPQKDLTKIPITDICGYPKVTEAMIITLQEASIMTVQDAFDVGVETIKNLRGIDESGMNAIYGAIAHYYGVTLGPSSHIQNELPAEHKDDITKVSQVICETLHEKILNHGHQKTKEFKDVQDITTRLYSIQEVADIMDAVVHSNMAHQIRKAIKDMAQSDVRKVQKHLDMLKTEERLQRPEMRLPVRSFSGVDSITREIVMALKQAKKATLRDIVRTPAQELLDIPNISTADAMNLCKAIEKIFTEEKKVQKETKGKAPTPQKKTVPTKDSKKPESQKEEQLAIPQEEDGNAPTRHQALLAKTPIGPLADEIMLSENQKECLKNAGITTGLNLVQLSKEKLTEIPGIGFFTAERICRFIQSRYRITI